MRTISQVTRDCHIHNQKRAVCAYALMQRAVLAILLFVGAFCAVSLQAQTATFKSVQLRVTVPLGYNGTVLMTSNLLTIRTNGAALDGTGTNWIIGNILPSVTGAPAGVTAIPVDSSGNLVSSIPVALNTNNTSKSTNLMVKLTFDGTEPQGVSTLSFNVAGGVVNNILLTLQVGSFWTGTTNVSTAWSSTASWLAGTLPSSGDDVLFTQLGAQTNVLVGGAIFSNSVVDQNFTVSSLRFSPTNSAAKYHTIQINPGVNLAVAGTNGFSILKDYPNAYTGLGGITVTFTGIGGSLLVTNEQANFVEMVDNGQATLLDLSGLGTFVANVNRVGLGDYTLWPNYRNLNDANVYGGIPRQFLSSMNMARTNVIRATFADPFNYTNADDRRFSFSFLNSEISGSTTSQNLNLGISNIFYVDSINFGGGNSRGNAQFNSIFNASNPVAIFLGTNGDRMSVFSIADGAGTNTSQTSPNNNVNFLPGTVTILADRFYIGRDRKLIPVGQNPSYVGNFFMGKGSVDVNTVILGYREYNQTNATLGQVSLGYCGGAITVSNTGVFKVNQLITLGSTVATNVNEESTGGNTDRGQITVTGGGTLIANAINVGGPVYGMSRNNNITVSGVTGAPTASTLIVSNTIAGTNQFLDNFTLSGGSTLQLSIDGNHSGPYVYTTNITFSSTTTNNVLRVGSMQNLPPNAQVPIIYHATATAGTLPTVLWPVGFSGAGSLVDNGANNTIDLLVSTIPPKNLVWRGASGATWDLTSKNWLDQTTGLMTNFNTFDIVAFDDAPGYATNISVAVDVIPGTINMTNNSLSYTFLSSGGKITGSAVLTKTGAGFLDVEMETSASYVINEGIMIVGSSGSAASVTVGAGAWLNNNGTINNGVTCSGFATINSGATLNGSLNVPSGGVVTNLATVQHGPITLQSGGFLYNGNGATLDDFSSSTIASNAVLINDGFIGSGLGGYNQSLTLSGTLKDSGASGLPSMSLVTLTVNPGATFIPGGDGIGTSSVRNPLGITTGTPGRVLLNAGSTNIFKVDPGAPANTVLLSGYQDFGPSQSSQIQNGCTIVIVNVGATPFAAGQTFKMFGKWSGGNVLPTGTSTNSFPIISPASPGPGLAWDLTHLWTDNGSGSWGYIGVITPPHVVLTNSFTVLGGTNIVAQFSWPSTNYGWRLQSLTVPNTVGLTPNTNYTWNGVPGSWTNTSMTITNTIGTNSVFYRLSYP